jgi:hypothetical protein
LFQYSFKDRGHILQKLFPFNPIDIKNEPCILLACNNWIFSKEFNKL